MSNSYDGILKQKDWRGLYAWSNNWRYYRIAFEWNNYKSKDFKLFTHQCSPTDDSIMTLAIAKAIMESKPDYSDLGDQAVKCMQEVGQPYPRCGYGGNFFFWMYSEKPTPYISFGNGAAMRVSPCGFAGNSIEEVKILCQAQKPTCVSVETIIITRGTMNMRIISTVRIRQAVLMRPGRFSMRRRISSRSFVRISRERTARLVR